MKTPLLRTALKYVSAISLLAWPLWGLPAAAEEMDHSMKCHIPVAFAESSETKLGGALYSGPKMAPDDIMTVMTDAHQVHHPQYGGAFFMAPNKLNHIEVVYSEACGARVYMFNAYTEPIRADRFMAFVEFVPKSEDQIEVIRFLEPSENGYYLMTGANHGLEPPFDIDLYMKFPDSDVVELFTVKLKPDQPNFAEGVGKVVEIDHSAARLVIDHEAIPGYMSAMKMPYSVSSPDLLDHVEPGMVIKFKIDRKNNTVVDIVPNDG